MKYTSIKHMLTTALLVFLSLCFSVSSKGTDYGSSTRIWHESLGTPPYGYYVLESTVTSYSFVHYLPSDYEEDISVVWDEMATQIRSVPELSSWVTLTDLSWNSNYSGIIFSLSFTENTGTSSRSITFGTPSCSTVTMIVQNGRSDTDEDTDTGPDIDTDTGDGNVSGGDDDGVAAEPTDYTEGLNMSDSHNWIFTALVGDDDSAVRSLTYYDGLGYPSHDVQVNGSGNCTSDLVTHHVYDYLHRETRTYLPYPKASNLGGYDSSGVQGQDSWYKSRFDIMDPSAYAWVGSRYENSSEGRLLGTTMPGFVYHEYGRESTCSYRGNVSGEVFLLDVDFSSGSVTVSGHYQPSTLSCVTSTDEDGRQKSVFKDLDARVVLERSLVSCGASGNEYADTYYAYDLLGRLSLVISPLGSALLSVGTVIPFPSIDAEDRSPLQSYCYGYRYDGRNRVVEKVIPDASAVYFVYDSGDRPVMVQDGNLRAVGKWRTTEYDAIGRSIRERIVPTLLTRSSLQSSFTSGTYPTVYTSGSGELLIERAYDVYPSSMASSLSFLDVPGVTSVGDSTSHDPRSLGLLTYEKIAVLDGGGMVERSYYYDYRGNVVQSVELRPGNRTLRISSRYDRQGRLLSREDRHVVSGASPPVTDVLSTAFNYDSFGRLTREYMTLERNGQNAYARVEYSYDDLGRVSGRRYDDLEYSPDETLEYDLQGRLVRQNLYVYDYDAFTSVLHYDDSVNGAVPQYGGNISSWEWNLRSYAFNYDGLSRLTGAEQYESDALENEFTERNIVYDLNGNILSLQRHNGSTTPVTSSFAYEGNRRTSDSHDANGNVTLDSATGQDATYNVLNLPNRMYGIDYYVTQRYLADGTKLETEEDETYAGYYYAGPFRYYNNEGEVSLESAGFSCGRFVEYGSSFVPQYHIKDHLGSVRVVADHDGEVVASYNYLPYGTLLNDEAPQYGNNRYLYGGKELQESFEIEWYDSGARFQTLNGVFTGIDPMAEKFYGVSPYAYCAGNPVMYVDPDGNIIGTVLDVVSVGLGVKSLISNIRAGNTREAWKDAGGIAVDMLAAALPVVPGGVGAVRAGLKAADATMDVAKGAAKVTDDVGSFAKNVARGRESEARVLKDLDLTKNTKTYNADLSGKQVKTIPDAVSDGKLIEIKDVKNLSNTKQIRAQYQYAERNGLKHVIYVGENTHVSKNVQAHEIIRRKDLGPQN